MGKSPEATSGVMVTFVKQRTNSANIIKASRRRSGAFGGQDAGNQPQAVRSCAKSKPGAAGSHLRRKSKGLPGDLCHILTQVIGLATLCRAFGCGRLCPIAWCGGGKPKDSMNTAVQASGKVASREQIMANVARWRREHGMGRPGPSRREFNSKFNSIEDRIPQKARQSCQK